MRRATGVLGGVGVLAAILGVIVVVGATVVGLQDRGPERLEIPADVPPAAAAPVDPDDATAVSDTASDLGIPADFLHAYLVAAHTVGEETPGCHLVWNTLAGLGQAESRHGSYGVVDGRIIGPQLNGTGGFMEIPDTDHGVLDGDDAFDRAVGPLQFLPDSWRIYGAGGDPQNIDDAAAAAGRLMCDHDRDLGRSEGWAEAVFAYNRSGEYLTTVRDAAANYALGQAAE